MLPDGEAGQEEVLLLDVASQGGEAGGAQQLLVGSPGAGDSEALAVSEDKR